MGSRAVITTKDKEIGVYLHWNGDKVSVGGFLKFCELMKFRSPETDCYGWARLCQVIANFFGGDSGGLSVGIDKYKNLDTDNGDNGVYIIENWKIVGREYTDKEDTKDQEGDAVEEMVMLINKHQPMNTKLGEK